MLFKSLTRRPFSLFATERNEAFARLNGIDLRTFESIVGSKGLVTDEGELAGYNTDWTKKFIGQSRLVVRPGSTEECAAVLKYCNERKLAVVPQGGNTGLVGGNVPVFDEVIL